MSGGPTGRGGARWGVSLWPALCCAAVGICLTACGVADPYVDRHAPASAQRSHLPEEARRLPVRVRVPRISAGRDPRAAARAFALAWTNWSWRRIATSERRRAALATGPLREQIAQDAAAAVHDTTLARDRIENRGEVLAIDVQVGGRTYVLMRETNTSAGLDAIGDSAIRVYRATVARAARGWLVAAWAPLD